MCPVDAPVERYSGSCLRLWAHPIHFCQLLTLRVIRAADVSTRPDHSINLINPGEKALPRTATERLGGPLGSRKDAR